MLWGNPRESSDPYYDILEDFELIVSSFQAQYGIRLSRELPAGMKWEEFKDLLIGIGPDTALGRIVSIRAEDRKEVLENFLPEYHRIRNEWKTRHAKFIEAHTSKEAMDAQINAIKAGFLAMEGLGGD